MTVFRDKYEIEAFLIKLAQIAAEHYHGREVTAACSTLAQVSINEYELRDERERERLDQFFAEQYEQEIISRS
jgi:hypothetical protein